MENLIALIYSPLVGPFTWSSVQAALSRRGRQAIIPAFTDDEATGAPYWLQHSRRAAEAINAVAQSPATLVAHSGAGALLPAIAERLHYRAAGYVFVDAVIPQDGLSRLDLLALEDAEFAAQFYALLASGGQFPTWSADDLGAILPDAHQRRALIAELKPRSLDFFTETIPVFAGWPDAPCSYVQFSPSYDSYAHQAQAAGWAYLRMEAGHFHMLVDPESTAEAILQRV